MNMKYGTVIDGKGNKVAFVRVLVDAEDRIETALFSPQRELTQDEKIVYSDWQVANGMLKPQWDNKIWKETATPEEIAAAETERIVLFAKMES